MPILEGTVQEFAVLAFALEQSIAQLRTGLATVANEPALRTTREHIETQLRVSEALLARVNEIAK